MDWVANRIPGTESVRRVRREPPTVGGGKTEVIARGLELSCPIVLDDRRVRLRARRAGVEITGTLVSRDLEEDVRLLEEADMRISPELRRAVLEADAEKRDEGQQPGRWRPMSQASSSARLYSGRRPET